MTWELLLPIIARYGIEAAELIWQRWTSGSVPTQADWDVLKKLGQKSPEDMIMAAATALGVPPDDDRIKALLSLVKSP